MARYTAPVRGHSSAAAAACPACRNRSGYRLSSYSYDSYPSYSWSFWYSMLMRVVNSLAYQYLNEFLAQDNLSMRSIYKRK